MPLDATLLRLEREFSKHRAKLLATDAGRWAVFVQPTDRRFRPQFVGCFDDAFEALDAGYRSEIGPRLIVKEVLETEPVVSVPWVTLADHS